MLSTSHEEIMLNLEFPSSKMTSHLRELYITFSQCKWGKCKVSHSASPFICSTKDYESAALVLVRGAQEIHQIGRPGAFQSA